MKKDQAMPERKIRPYKTSCRKCETPEDVRDMLRLESDNINGNSERKKPIILANNIEEAEDILTNPDNVADQFVQQQEEILCGEKCRSRRVNVMTFLIDEKKYGVNIDEGIELGWDLMSAYRAYSSVVAITENEGILRIDYVANNFGFGDIRLTQVFKPATLYNCYKANRKRNNVAT